MSSYRLAQINFSRLGSPLADPKMGSFLTFLASVNELADASPGFVWRLDERSATVCSDRVFPKEAPGTTLVNLSVWKSVGALQRYANLGINGGVLDSRQSWFKRFEGRWVVLWWVPEGHFPEVVDGWRRLQHLQRHHETPYAFSLRRPFPPPVGGQDHLPLPPSAKPGGAGYPANFPLAARRAGIPWYLDW